MLSFEEVRTGATFYQSVFIAIQPSAQLSQLHQHVHGTLGVQPKTPEFPHLSLYYGDEGKDEIVRKLYQTGITHNLESKGTVTVGGIKEFLASEIWVVKCADRPLEWTVVDKIALNPHDSS